MGVERRREPRIFCKIPCELRIAGRSVAGHVRNVSAGGLAVVAEAPNADQGEEVTVTMEAASIGVIEVRAIVWHVRASKRSASEKTNRSFGLVLSDTAPAFAQLLQRLSANSAKSPPRFSAPDPSVQGRPAAEAPKARSTAADAPRLREYRIRLKELGGAAQLPDRRERRQRRGGSGCGARRSGREVGSAGGRAHQLSDCALGYDSNRIGPTELAHAATAVARTAPSLPSSSSSCAGVNSTSGPRGVRSVNGDS